MKKCRLEHLQEVEFKRYKCKDIEKLSKFLAENIFYGETYLVKSNLYEYKFTSKSYSYKFLHSSPGYYEGFIKIKKSFALTQEQHLLICKFIIDNDLGYCNTKLEKLKNAELKITKLTKTKKGKYYTKLFKEIKNFLDKSVYCRYIVKKYNSFIKIRDKYSVLTNGEHYKILSYMIEMELKIGVANDKVRIAYEKYLDCYYEFYVEEREKELEDF